MSSTPMRRCGPRRRPLSAAAARDPPCGPREFPAMLPIVLLRIEHIEDLAIARQLLQAHEYWQLEAARSRSRDPERTRGFLCAGSAGRSRNGCPHASLTSATSCRQRARALCSCCAPTRFLPRHERYCRRLHESCSSARAARSRINSSVALTRSVFLQERDALRRASTRAPASRNLPSSSSSTAWADSPRTDASTQSRSMLGRQRRRLGST